MTDSSMRKKYYNVDFLRFIFSILIVYFHILNSNIMSFVGNSEFYLKLKAGSSYLATLVECFLIMAGFFLAVSENSGKQKPFILTFMNRFFRLWPVYAFYTIIFYSIYRRALEEAVFNITMLHATGISLYYKEIIWYISPFFWSSLLCIGIMRVFPKKVYALIFALTAYLGYSVNINQTKGGFGRNIAFGYLSLAFLRCLAGVAFGIILYLFIYEWRKTFTEISNKKSIFIIFTIIELAVLSTFVSICLTDAESKIWTNRFVVIIFFTFLFLLFIIRKGAVSRFLDKPALGFCGKYSYSIYVMQQISFNILRQSLWKKTDIVRSYPVPTVIVSVVFSVLVGIVVYYIIEKPAADLWNRYKQNHYGVISK